MATVPTIRIGYVPGELPLLIYSFHFDTKNAEHYNLQLWLSKSN